MAIFSFVLISLLYLSDVSFGQGIREPQIGEATTLNCYPNISTVELYWVKRDELGDNRLYSFFNGSGVVHNPLVHEVSNDESWFNLTILRSTTRDGGNYACIAYDPSNFTSETTVRVFVSGTIPLRNMVVPYNTPVELTYFANFSIEDNVQWTFMHVDRNNFKTFKHIYYANTNGGGVLPSSSPLVYEPAGYGNGVYMNRLLDSNPGKYKYFVMNPPEVVQSEFWVVGTDKLQCTQSDPIYEDRLTFQICAATVGFGDIMPIFSWTRNGVLLPGTLELGFTSSWGNYWIYRYQFEPQLDDVGAEYVCSISFRYAGEVSAKQDTSDPEYTDSCTIRYEHIEYPVRNIVITPSSGDGDPFPIRAGQYLYCAAEGYPEIEYEWECSGFVGAVGQYWLVDKEMIEFNPAECQCMGKNTLSDGVNHNDTTSVEYFATHPSGVRVVPRDRVVRIGEAVQLQCTTLDFGHETDNWHVQWAANFNNDQDSSRILYYSNLNASGVLSEWRDDFADGGFKHDLIMRFALLSLAGGYTCMELTYDQPSDYWESQIVVISTLKCGGQRESKKKGANVMLSCNLEYAGNIDPEIQWSHGPELIGMGKESSKKSQETGAKLKEHNIVVGAVGASSMEDYICKATFKSHDEVIHTEECNININKI